MVSFAFRGAALRADGSYKNHLLVIRPETLAKAHADQSAGGGRAPGNAAWRGSRVRMRPPGVLAHERGAMLLQSLRRAPAGAGATHMGCRSRQRRSGRAAGHASAEAGWRQGGGAEVRAQSIAARAAGFLAMRQSGRSSAAVSAPYPQVAAMKGRALASAELPSSSRSPM